MVENEFIRSWAKRLSKKYPKIEEIILIGSRAYDIHRKNSDWDIIIVLKQVAENNILVNKEIAKQIWTDNDFYFEGLDLFVYEGNDFIENYKNGGVMRCYSMSRKRQVSLFCFVPTSLLLDENMNGD